ncbi:MAG TPA: amidase [Methylomirabilota bacterium]|nr:amidase [Methylomirabilota bacterium]
MSAPLWALDAVELADMIRRREVSCREAVSAALARLDAVNPRINAVVRPLHEQALAEAAAADQVLARGGPVGPLHGVPITTKVNVDQIGCPTDNGVVAFKALVATRDNPVVANLRRAGAIVIGRTNTPAFSMRWFTDNALHGATRNPWDPARTPGGSSGGAAAATAVGIGAVGHGNDIAGSVRYPAYCCGLVGLRVSYGRIPSWNFTATTLRPVSAQLMAVQGPLTRRVRDARAAFAAMAVPDPNDPRCADVPLDGPPAPRPVRVALVADPAGRGGVAPTVAAAVRRAGRWLEEAGYAVEEVEPPELGAVADCWATIAMEDVIAALEPAAAQYGDAGIKEALGLWRAVHPPRDVRHVLDGLAQRDRLLRLWELFLEERPLVVTPTSNEPAFPVDLDRVDADTTRRIMRAQIMQLVVPVLGLPAISVPTGLADGVPIGVQITAGRFREDLCLEAAAGIEARAPMATPIDPRQ